MTSKAMPKNPWPTILGFKQGDAVYWCYNEGHRNESYYFGWIISTKIPHYRRQRNRVLVGVVKKVSMKDSNEQGFMCASPSNELRLWTDAPPMPKRVKDAIALRGYES